MAGAAPESPWEDLDRRRAHVLTARTWHTLHVAFQCSQQSTGIGVTLEDCLVLARPECMQVQRGPNETAGAIGRKTLALGVTKSCASLGLDALRGVPRACLEDSYQAAMLRLTPPTAAPPLFPRITGSLQLGEHVGA
jgi:hypothetical protein